MSSPRAWGWLAHLRDGGTTPWREWATPGQPSAPVFPGAQQLELLRRVNLAALASASASASTSTPALRAEAILSASPAGRGKPDLPLTGTTEAPGHFGPRAVDPSRLAPDELTRVAVSVLADDLIARLPESGSPSEPVSAQIPESRPRLIHRRYRLVGDPVAVSQTRNHLIATRRPPGGKNPLVIALGGPMDEMLAHAWTHRCFHQGSVGWRQWLRFWRERDQVPPRLDLAAVIAEMHPGRGRGVVVTDANALPGLVGVRRLPRPSVPGADAAELARQVASLLGLLVPIDVRTELMSGTLAAAMPHTPTPPAGIPESHREWVAALANRVIRQVQRDGYAVRGHVRDLEPRFEHQVMDRETLSAAVLDLAITLLVDERWTEKRR